MFISYEWLKELTDTRLSPAELRERLTMVGLAIDAVEEHNGDAVAPSEFTSRQIQPGDRLEIVKIVAGG